MVPLSARDNYIAEVSSSNLANALIQFIWEKNVNKISHASKTNAEDVSILLMQSIQGNNDGDFVKLHENLSRRRFNAESDWLYNDTLFFTLCVGIVQFSISPEWVISALKSRVLNTKEIELSTNSFIDIIEGNYYNRNNYFPVILVAAKLLGINIEDIERINQTYEWLVTDAFPYSKSQFLNIICIRAADVIVVSKGLIDIQKNLRINQFLETYTKRVNLISQFFWLVIVILLLLGVYNLIYYNYSHIEKFSDKIDLTLNLVQIIGLSSASLLSLVPRNLITSFITKCIHKFLGYDIE